MHQEVTEFFDVKSKAACFYIEGMLAHQIPFDEVLIFVWDTLEEWWQTHQTAQPLSEKEQVLWHLFHLVKRWPEQALRHNTFLRHQLEQGCDFLQAKGPMLLDCPSVRP